MAFQTTVYTLPLLVISGFGGVTAYLIWKRYARALAGVIAAVAIAVLAEALFLSLTSYEAKLGLLLAAVYGQYLIGFAWFVFGARYGGYDWWGRGDTLRVLQAFAVIVGVFVASNPLHGLVVREASLETVDSVVVLDYSLGLGAWMVFGLLYLSAIMGTVFVFDVYMDSKNLYRKQSLMLIIGMFPPLVGHVVSALGFSPFPNFVLAAFLFVLSGGLLLLALYGYKFVDVVPMARDSVMQELRSGVLVLDHRNRVTDINPAAKDLLGTRDPVGKPLEQVLGDYTDKVEDFSRGDEVHTELTVGDRHLDFRASPLVDHRDNAVGSLILMNDITELKKREEELRRQNERLDKFANVVSHDLRNPLNVAQGYLDLAEEEESLDELGEVRESLDRMADIIEDVLTLAKEGQKVSETQEVEVAEVVREAWVNVYTDDADLDCDVGLTVEGDRDRLLRVFENLFRNSVEHGGSSVSVRVGETDEGFYVEDTGPGIPEGERDAVLEQGYTTSDGGTGFGLSIVRNIVEAHGWRLEVEESEGGGARFVVSTE